MLKQNQQILGDAQQKLDSAQKQATARVDEKVKQDVDAMRLKLAETRAKLMAQAGRRAGEQGDVLLGQKQNLDIQNAAPNGSSHLSGIPLHAINDLQNGNGQPPLQSVDLFSYRPSLLANSSGSGIIDEGRKQLESNNATVSQDKGNRPFRELAANGTLTDVGYANGNQDVKASDEEYTDTVKEPSINDLFSAVITPEQLKYFADLNNEALGFFTDEQRQRALAGGNFGDIFDELDLSKQDQINKLSQKVLDKLTTRQKSDLLFLGSGLFAGIDLKTRQAILQHLKRMTEK